MSAERLQEAARLMRERAEAASESPWTTYRTATTTGVTNRWRRIAARQNNADFMSPSLDAAHIASWHPAVALTVADWLERIAYLHNHGSTGPGDVVPALAVANAYLGGDA